MSCEVTDSSESSSWRENIKPYCRCQTCEYFHTCNLYHLNSESSLASLESPACTGPVVGVLFNRAWAQVEKEKNSDLGEVLLTKSCPGSQTRSFLCNSHPPVYCRCNLASSGPFGVKPHVWDSTVFVLLFFQEKLLLFHK